MWGDTDHKCALGARQRMPLLKKLAGYFVNKDSLTLRLESLESTRFRYSSKLLILDWKTIEFLTDPSYNGRLFCSCPVSPARLLYQRTTYLGRFSGYKAPTSSCDPFFSHRVSWLHIEKTAPPRKPPSGFRFQGDPSR